MMRAIRIAATILFLTLAGALILGIFHAHGWGGRMEVLLSVFGKPVWVALDTGRPRFLILLLVPGIFLASAYALRAWRPSASRR